MGAMRELWRAGTMTANTTGDANPSHDHGALRGAVADVRWANTGEGFEMVETGMPSAAVVALALGVCMMVGAGWLLLCVLWYTRRG